MIGNGAVDILVNLVLLLKLEVVFPVMIFSCDGWNR